MTALSADRTGSSAASGTRTTTACTSVTTTLTRLQAKGLVERVANGRTFSYSPTAKAAEDVAARMSPSVVVMAGLSAVACWSDAAFEDEVPVQQR